MARIGVYPGSFNPPTHAHLAIAQAACVQHGLDRVDLVHSHRVLGKDRADRPLFEHRVQVLSASVAPYSQLRAVVTDKQLIVDIAYGYDIVIMGADKWHQIQDPVWYNNDTSARDMLMARLPTVAVAPRPPLEVPDGLRLNVDAGLVLGFSSTMARQGKIELMAPPAAEFALRTGAWIDPTRYELGLPHATNPDQAI